MRNRTLVALKSCIENKFTIAKFTECLVDYFESDSISSAVKCTLEENLLKLSPAANTHDKNSATVTTSSNNQVQWDMTSNKFTFSDTDFVILQHSPECPIANLSEEDKNVIPADVQNRGIDVAVSILVESADNRVLMTKRPDHMRTFPRAWVPPGGHIEEGENLIDAGLRELKEETGLTLLRDTKIQVLCLWESVYPVLLGLGTPVRHHVVVYLLAKISSTSSDLLPAINLDPEEVQACAWLDLQAVDYLLAGGRRSGRVAPEQQMLVLQTGGGLAEGTLDLSTMYHPSLWGHGQEVYSGSQLALQCWAKSLHTPTSPAKL